jgi:hypothetical protein
MLGRSFVGRGRYKKPVQKATAVVTAAGTFNATLIGPLRSGSYALTITQRIANGAESKPAMVGEVVLPHTTTKGYRVFDGGSCGIGIGLCCAAHMDIYENGQHCGGDSDSRIDNRIGNRNEMDINCQPDNCGINYCPDNFGGQNGSDRLLESVRFFDVADANSFTDVLDRYRDAQLDISNRNHELAQRDSLFDILDGNLDDERNNRNEN